MTEIIILITAIAAFVTAVANLLLIREMKKQRNLNYKPELMCRNFKIINKINLDDLSFSVFNWSNFPVNKFGNEKVLVNCYNIGNGIAQNVRFEWMIDLQKIISSIIEKDYDLINSFYLTENGLSIDIPKYNFKSIHYVTSQLNWNEEFIVSSEVDKLPIQLSFPSVVLCLLTLVYAGLGNSIDAIHNLKADAFDISLIIEYLDFEKNAHKKEVKFKLSIEALSRFDDKNYELKGGYKVHYV